MSRLREYLVSTTMLLALVRYGGVAAGFLTQLVLARLLTPDSLGVFFAATSTAVIAATFASFGYSEIVPRYFLRYQARGRIGLLSGFIRHCHRDIMFLSALGFGMILLGAMLWPDASIEVRVTFIAVAAWIPILAYLDFNSWIALSVRSFFLSYVPESFLKPVLFLGVVAALLLLGFEPAPVVLVVVFIVISAVLCLGLWILIQPKIPKNQEHATRAIDPAIILRWRRDGCLQIPISIYTALFADLTIIVLAILLPASELAAFAIALKMAMLVGFVVQVAHQVMIPELAEAHAERRFGEATVTMRRAVLMPSVFIVLALVGALLFGDRALAIFHPDFAAAHQVLVILICCQFLRVFFGPVVQLLTIIGAQFYNACLCVSSALILMIASAIFVPNFGIVGAAYSIFTCWFLWLAASAITLNRLAGVRSDILALLVAPRLTAKPDAG